MNVIYTSYRYFFTDLSIQVKHSVQVEDDAVQGCEHRTWFFQCCILGFVWVIIFCTLAGVILFVVILVSLIPTHNTPDTNNPYFPKVDYNIPDISNDLNLVHHVSPWPAGHLDNFTSFQ